MKFLSNWQRIGLMAIVNQQPRNRSLADGVRRPSYSQGEYPKDREATNRNKSSHVSLALPLRREPAKPEAARRLRRLTAARVHRKDSRG